MIPSLQLYGSDEEMDTREAPCHETVKVIFDFYKKADSAVTINAYLETLDISKLFTQIIKENNEVQAYLISLISKEKRKYYFELYRYIHQENWAKNLVADLIKHNFLYVIEHFFQDIHPEEMGAIFNEIAALDAREKIEFLKKGYNNELINYIIISSCSDCLKVASFWEKYFRVLAEKKTLALFISMFDEPLSRKVASFYNSEYSGLLFVAQTLAKKIIEPQAIKSFVSLLFKKLSLETQNSWLKDIADGCPSFFPYLLVNASAANLIEISLQSPKKNSELFEKCFLENQEESALILPELKNEVVGLLTSQFRINISIDRKSEFECLAPFIQEIALLHSIDGTIAGDRAKQIALIPSFLVALLYRIKSPLKIIAPHFTDKQLKALLRGIPLPEIASFMKEACDYLRNDQLVNLIDEMSPHQRDEYLVMQIYHFNEKLNGWIASIQANSERVYSVRTEINHLLKNPLYKCFSTYMLKHNMKEQKDEFEKNLRELLVTLNEVKIEKVEEKTPLKFYFRQLSIPSSVGLVHDEDLKLIAIDKDYFFQVKEFISDFLDTYYGVDQAPLTMYVKLKKIFNGSFTEEYISEIINEMVASIKDKWSNYPRICKLIENYSPVDTLMTTCERDYYKWAYDALFKIITEKMSNSLLYIYLSQNHLEESWDIFRDNGMNSLSDLKNLSLADCAEDFCSLETLIKNFPKKH